ncbi:hypothetical protein SDJN02_27971, partial [Cucurbita argyrosperma subsp. argyrosperma]
MSDLVSDHKCKPMTNIAEFSSSFVCFTQLWNDEAERVQVLAEKHKRGAAARGVRALQKRKRKVVQMGGSGKNQGHVQLPRQASNSNGSRKSMRSRDKNNAVRRHPA